MNKTARFFLGMGLALVMMAPMATAWGAGQGPHSWEKVQFETPVPFSEPAKIGLDAVALLNPPEAALGKARMEVVLVYVPKDLQESLGNNEAEILNYVKVTFLGTAEPAESTTEREFLGKKFKGFIQKTTIPKPGEMEVFLVSLSDGDKMAIALTRDAGVPAEEARSVMDKLSQTLKEIPAK